MSGGWNPYNNTPGAVPPAASPDDPIVRYMTERRIRQYLMDAAGADPARLAQALDMSARAGIPLDVAERDLKHAQAQNNADRYAQAIAGSPALGPWLARDPVNARIALLDYDGLGEIDRAWATFRRGGEGAAGTAATRPDTAAAARLAAFNALGDRVAALKMAQFSPGKTEEVVRAIVGQGGPRGVLVPVKDVRSHLGALPPAEAEDRARAWGVDQLLRHDVADDDDLVSPTELYLTRLRPVAGDDIGRNARLSEPGSVGDCLAKCAQKIAAGDHYPSSSEWGRNLSYAGAIPIPKKLSEKESLHRNLSEKSSRFTNPISEMRWLFPPNEHGKRVPLSGGRKWLGTTSIPGFIGRANVLLTIPFLGYDAVHLGGCIGDCLGNPNPEDIPIPPMA